MEGDELSVTTNKPPPRNPPPDPNPTTGATPKNLQLVPTSESTEAETPKTPALVEGCYTCYRRPCINCADPFPAHLTPECKESTNPNVGLRLLWEMVTHQGIQLFAQAQHWNMGKTEDREPCGVCQAELKEHDFWTCIMRARIWTNFWGRIEIQPSHPKEKLDKCPVEPQEHSHQTIEEVKECFFKKKPMFKSSRRIEWQLQLRALRLIEVEEPCPKCGCFWKNHDLATCQGVRTREDNLWVVHECFYPEIVRVLKEIARNCGAAGNPPCPICDDEVSHDWLECMRMARYAPLELLDCEVALRPPMGPEEVLRLRRKPLLWVEDGADERPEVRSRLPLCHFCNRARPAHFPLECAQVWEEWEKSRYLCYKCQQPGADHISEECWVIGNRQQMRQELVFGLEARAKEIECCLEGNQCPLCSKSLLHDWHTIEDCLKKYARELANTDVQAFPQTEVTWKIYEGDIEVTQTWHKLSSGLRQCGVCDQRRPLHYPRECLTMYPNHHPCLFCGKEQPDHVLEDCPIKGD